MEDSPLYAEQPGAKETLWNKIYQYLPSKNKIILATTFTTSLVENILCNYDPFYNLITSLGACSLSFWIGNWFPPRIRWVPQVGYLIIMGTNIYAKTKVSPAHIKK